MNQPLPEFEDPPVFEVALSVQFEPLATLKMAHIGELRRKYKDRFPNLEEHPPIDTATEVFDDSAMPFPMIRLRLHDYLPLHRSWFINEENTRLVQIQRDRFVYNWRRADTGEPYPRYENVRKSFEDEYKIFESFLKKEELGPLIPNQCEVTYVNPIAINERIKGRGDLSELVTVFEEHFSDDFLRVIEDVRLLMRFVMCNSEGTPLGRLYIGAEPVNRLEDPQVVMQLNLIGRGKPASPDSDGVIDMLNLCHDWIVRGFTSVTREPMHDIWRRIKNNG